MTEAGSYSFDENNFKIFDNMLEGVSVYEPVYDREGKITDFIIRYVNHATIAGSGNSYEHYIGRSVTELYEFENIEPHFKIAEEIIVTGKSKTVKAYLPPLNRYFQVSGYLTPDGLFVMFRLDITDQENAAKELQKAHDDLEIKVQERTYKLQNANEKLKNEIEERKKVQERLIESEEKFRLLFNKADDMISLSEIKENGMPGKYIEVNEVGIKRMGYSREELLKMSPSDIIATDKHVEISKNAEKIAENGYCSFEIVHVTKEGRQIPVEVNGHVINFKGQKAYLTISRDVTNRKQMENDLIESEEKFREIFNKANDMIILYEMNENEMPGKFIEVNEVGCRKLGYTKDEFINMAPEKIIAPDKRVKMINNDIDLLIKGRATFETVHVAKNGKRIPVETTTHHFKIKGKSVIIGISRDIKERKQMENALKESEEKFREIFNNANDMITLHEMNENGMPGKFIEVNEVGSKRLGYTSEEFQDRAPVDIIAPDKRVEMANHAVEIWTNGYSEFEIVHIAKDGRRIPVEVNTHLFKLRGKTLALGISRDITERKDAEEKLKELLEKLSLFNEEFEQYTYITAHYVQEHLGTIADLTKNLKQEYNGKLDNEIKEFMEHITDESTNLKQIILSLLEYARISREKKEFKQVDLEKSLNKVLSDLTINKNTVEITYDKLPVVTADSDQIIKVFHALISNAINFKKDNKMLKIHISAHKDSENKKYTFGIRDNGVGIDPQCAKRIFEIYPHLCAQEQCNITGIGLAIAKEVIEGHGGKIWVESGVGTTFYFTLPIFNWKPENL